MNFKPYFTKITNFFLHQKLKHPYLFHPFVLGAACYGAGLIFVLSTQAWQNNYGRIMSKSMGTIGQLTIPTAMRAYIYGLYAKKYGVNLQEAELQLRQYKNFSQFFTRKIKPRQSTQQDLQNPKTICSPCDGQILNISKITSNQNIIIKDITYKINSFLFEQTHAQSQNMFNQLKFKKQNELYQVILYLCPGDYHRFHAPMKIDVRFCRHVDGKLRPVNIQSIVKNGGAVYEQNARKILHCSYKNQNNQRGYLGLAMVGALNVGDIVLNEKNTYAKGEEVGYFNLGSTIVMIVESNPNLKWSKKVGEKVQYGQKLCQFQ